MKLRRRSRLTLAGCALGFLLASGTTAAFLVERARARQAAQAERVRAAEQHARDDRRRRELQAGIDRFGEIKAELSAFGQWLRLTRRQILAGHASRTLDGIQCAAAQEGTRRAVTCSARHFPHGGPVGIRYEIHWYRDHPEDMRGAASEVPYSPLVTCDTLGLRQKERRTEGQLIVFDCSIEDSTESYTVRHTVTAGTQSTTLWWYSAGYPHRDQGTPRESGVPAEEGGLTADEPDPA